MPSVPNPTSGVRLLSVLFKSQYFPAALQSELAHKNKAEIQELLPVLGPVLGVGVLMFSVWDYFIDPAHALHALGVRLLFVLLGMAVYKPGFLHLSATLRACLLYWSYSCAVIVSLSLLDDGLIYGLPGITACVFMLAVISVRLDVLLFVATPPMILFAVLSVINLSVTGFINGIALYFMSVCLACILMFVIRFFRRKALLLEHEPIHAARLDPLTGLYNRGYLTELASREFGLARRQGRPMAVMMLDIDHFKKVNEKYGHDIGDQVIKAVAHAGNQSLGETDYIGRIGDEEFVCILPDTMQGDAMTYAERLRKNVEQIRINTQEGEIRFTVSIGVAVLNQSHANWPALLKDADAALYRARHEGCNRVVLAEVFQAVPAI